MSTENNISFESDKFNYRSRVVLGQPEVPKMVKFLLNKKIIKNEKQAQILLLGSTVLFFALSIFVFITFVF